MLSTSLSVFCVVSLTNEGPSSPVSDRKLIHGKKHFLTAVVCAQDNVRRGQNAETSSATEFSELFPGFKFC